MDLVVRKWEDALDPTWEFRAFVVRGQMTAITQYYMLCYIPEIARNSSKLATMMREFWATKIKDRIAPSGGIDNTYTIDFAITPEMDRIWVVELNHAPPTAGTALFDWTSARDRQIVSNGPFEMRVLTELVRTLNKERNEPRFIFVCVAQESFEGARRAVAEMDGRVGTRAIPRDHS